MTDPVADTLRRLAEQYAELVRDALGDRVVSIVLFGSVARGDPSPSSDIDLLIVARDLPAGQFARQRLLAAADAAFEPALQAAERQGIDPRLARIVRTPAEAARAIPLYLDMTEDAVRLHDPDGFFAGELDRVRAALRRLGSKRIREGRHWYWDLKPDFRRGDVIEI
ncbi:MAG: nucleotidyltransferase domain-containing protein [Candidatus Binatia bacterium]